MNSRPQDKRKIEAKLAENCPNFDVDVLIGLMRLVGRNFGYPDHTQPDDPLFHINRAIDSIKRAYQQRNAQELHTWMERLHTLMICFCYFHEALWYIVGDDKLRQMLIEAIENRPTTTAEEICAERSLLKAMLEQPLAMIKLIYDNWHKLKDNSVVTTLEKQQEAHNHRLAGSNHDEDNALTVNPNWHQLMPYIQSRQVRCRRVLNSFKIKLIVEGYISDRRESLEWFGIFKPDSKKRQIKINAADKFEAVAMGRTGIFFTPIEIRALKEDTGSKLTRLYNDLIDQGLMEEITEAQVAL